ncbi:MAG: cysteine desulfurase family protein [Oscillospiraceae bacterium]|jgi:cysteine desulfurase
MIYLDNASTTKPCAEAVTAVTQALTDNFGKPSSPHGIGIEAEKAISAARKRISSALFCEPECVFFTSGATESNNFAIAGTAESYGKRKKRVVISNAEHPSAASPGEKLEKLGFEVVRASPQSILNAVDENTCFVSCMLVNNETGAIFPVEKLFSAIKRRFPDIITHCDAVQAFLKIPFRAKTLNADIISLSGHKVYAPKGVGAVYVKKGVRPAPLIIGGGQEKNVRSGTESVPLICAFGAAVEKFMGTTSQRLEYITGLKKHLLERLSELENITVLSPDNASPYIVSIAVAGIKSETMLHFLEAKGIYVSSGSACSKGKKSGVLKALGADERLLDFIIRISFSHENTALDIDRLVMAIMQGQRELLKIKF